ncbi:MAG: hypothetical protein QM713_11355 [Arachnia sp.]
MEDEYADATVEGGGKAGDPGERVADVCFGGLCVDAEVQRDEALEQRSEKGAITGDGRIRLAAAEEAS